MYIYIYIYVYIYMYIYVCVCAFMWGEYFHLILIDLALSFSCSASKHCGFHPRYLLGSSPSKQMLSACSSPWQWSWRKKWNQPWQWSKSNGVFRDLPDSSSRFPNIIETNAGLGLWRSANRTGVWSAVALSPESARVKGTADNGLDPFFWGPCTIGSITQSWADGITWAPFQK